MSDDPKFDEFAKVAGDLHVGGEVYGTNTEAYDVDAAMKAWASVLETMEKCRLAMIKELLTVFPSGQVEIMAYRRVKDFHWIHWQTDGKGIPQWVTLCKWNGGSAWSVDVITLDGMFERGSIVFTSDMKTAEQFYQERIERLGSYEWDW